jgi:hypothetical protein
MYLADDDRRLSKRLAAQYLGFRSALEVRDRVARRELSAAEVDSRGRMYFRLAELRRYSRHVALLAASPRSGRAA